MSISVQIDASSLGWTDAVLWSNKHTDGAQIESFSWVPVTNKTASIWHYILIKTNTALNCKTIPIFFVLFQHHHDDTRLCLHPLVHCKNPCELSSVEYIDIPRNCPYASYHHSTTIFNLIWHSNIQYTWTNHNNTKVESLRFGSC